MMTVFPHFDSDEAREIVDGQVPELTRRLTIALTDELQTEIANG